MDPMLEHVLEFIHDDKHFVARGLKQLQAQTGTEPNVLAGGIGGLIAVYLIGGAHAQFVANAILTIVPLLITFVFVKERPLTSHILIYWSCYSFLTLFDNVLQEVPCYYLVKVGLLALLFLRPFVYIDKILAIIKNADDGAEHALFTTEELRELENMQRGKKSPPPEKPEGERPQNSLRQAPGSRRMAPVGPSVSMPVGPSRIGSQRSTRTAIPPTDKTPSIRALPTAAAADRPPSIRAPPTIPEQPPVSPTVSDTQMSNASDAPNTAMTALSIPSNTMIRNPDEYQLSADSPMAVSPSGRIGDVVNLNDMSFWPMNKLVFNGPFDDRTLTYYMNIQNNSNKHIAFAIKSNAIPRITATPPHGILQPKQKQTIGIHLEKFSFEDVQTERDRIAYDYAFCPPETKGFSHKLFQNADTRRRKNIRIEYNP
ncbi:Protein C36H8.1 [Aphelenchoides avenae]|nr:Protein C36H8.1 [Aphelenchus avenae]